jgi:DNA-binding transcriptional ArsR family regulator
MTKKEIKNIFKSEVKKDILDFLMTEDGAYFGDLVMNMEENQLTILEHLIELKKMGWIYKDTEGGRFRINDEYFAKRKAPLKEGKRLSSRERTIIDELNQFSETTRAKEKEVDNEISINKLSPGEQKVEGKKSRKK